MYKQFLTLGALLLSVLALAQGTAHTSSIRGTVIDKQSQYPLPGAIVLLVGSDPAIAVATDVDGRFKLPQVPVGRQTVQVTLLGYEVSLHPNLLVNSGKEFELNVQLSESVTTTAEVQITAEQNKSETINKMSSVSTRTLSIEEAQRYSGTLQDVSRMAQNYAGVSGASDDRNDIIIRGNSPTGVLWRLEGIDIPSPNHFSTLGTTGGPISLINTNNLSNSDFATSAFAAEYGNALGGVFDLRLRSGNRDKHEFMGQMGFNGFELGAEGPLSRKSGATYMINARYSFLGIMTSLGIDFGTGAAVPEYQDITFKIDLPTEKWGKFSVFGIGGTSFIDFKAQDSDGENLYSESNENNQFSSSTGIIGLSHAYFFNEKTSGRFVLAATTSGTEGYIDTLDRAFNATRFFGILQRQNEFKANYTINSKINARNTIKAGVHFNAFDIAMEDSLLYQGNYYFKERDVNATTQMVRGFAQWQNRPNEKMTFNAGIFGQMLALNNQATVEPRLGMRYALNAKQNVSAGVGLHSQMQPIVMYFNQDETQNGDIVANNKNLGFNKALHTVLGYENQLAPNFRLKAEVYYQYLYDIAVDRSSSSFSALNLGADFTFPNNADLVNSGTGYNYGLELTLEKFLQKGFYFLLTSSLFESKYKGSDGVLRNTAFNGNYVFNVLAGKEWKIGQNTAFTADIKGTYAGGRWYSPVLLDASNAAGREIRDDINAYSEQLSPYFRTDFKLGIRMNYKKFAQAFYFDVRNVTNQQNVFSESYSTRSKQVTTRYQTGFFPIFLYQVWF